MSTTAFASDLPVTDLAVSESVAVTLDGGMQFWAGLSYGAASLVNYLVLSGRLVLPSPAMIGLVWMAASAAFVLFGVVLKVGSDPMLRLDAGHRRFRAVWLSLILGAFVVIAVLAIVLGKLTPGFNISLLTAPIALSVYAVGWRVAAIMSGRRWPGLLSLGCFIGALGLAALAGQPEQALVYTLCLVAFAVIPGLLLMLRRA